MTHLYHPRPLFNSSSTRRNMLLFPLFLGLYAITTSTLASVTVWSQRPMGGQATSTASAAAANYTGAAAYDPTVLNAPAIPDSAPPDTFSLHLGPTNTTQGGLSILLPGTFFGFSIEMSVVNQVREYFSSSPNRTSF